MIIGIEHVHLLTSLKIREGCKSDPVATKTRIGWCIYGRNSGSVGSVEQLNLHVGKEMSNSDLYDSMKQFFAVEEAVITKPLESEEDQRANNILAATTVRRGCRIESGLLWRKDDIYFPESYKMAMSRLRGLEKRLSRDAELRRRVNEQIASYEEKQYISKGSLAEVASLNPHRVWYLPLGVVINPKKPNKIRMVWDAAAKVGGVCFNDMLLKGPDLLVSLMEVLLRFRQGKVAVCSDIREMFLRILIREEDKWSQCFLWRRRPEEDVQVYVINVAMFGATSSPCTAQYVKNWNASEYSEQYPRAVEAVIKNHYVDDFLDSVNSVEESGFQFGKILSNEQEVLDRLGETSSAISKPLPVDKDRAYERVLGITWIPSEDIFTFSYEGLEEVLGTDRTVPTKRQVLRIIMKLYDPLGFVAHFVVQGKILMQEIWRTGTNWDEPIAEQLHDLWSRWIELYRKINDIQRQFWHGFVRTVVATETLWRQAQSQVYSEEIHLLCDGHSVAKGSSIRALSPFLDEGGVLRVGGRIEHAPTIPYEAKHPVVLPRNHRITYLVVLSYHQQFLHANSETVCNELRQQFYIPRMRSTVRSVCRSCQYCMIKKATPAPPMMGPLPKVRLTPFVRPFTYVGVDYMGPFEVKVGRSIVKRWICLFTCLTVRAVHLELAHSLSTKSCVMAFRRFINRRGAPLEVFLDNGTNFVGASRQLSEEMQRINDINSDCASTFTNARTQWHFNAPAAPHMGGPWERMVKSVKVAMTAISNSPHHPSDEVLETVMLEAEGIVNSRPLTYVPLEATDREALTPNHFLLYGSSGIKQPTVAADQSVTLRDSWTIARNIMDEFWRRWVREYLPMLTRRTKWFDNVKPLRPGDLVVIIDENARNCWERGRILEVFPDKSGQVRRATVQTARGVFTRPAVKLAVLDVVEVSKEPEEVVPETEVVHGAGDVTGNTVHRETEVKPLSAPSRLSGSAELNDRLTSTSDRTECTTSVENENRL
ncbi:uncharacterized protein LOC134288773 [Aedes albopictus]|uniref:Integrase catalytic domain-containing protein n=1 Tax=Aedes albopictus TaxID=7160 RepID=A0ABM2A3M1_AEDAL